MLKIKKDIDLKVLEKYGLKRVKIKDKWAYEREESFYSTKEHIIIFEESRNIILDISYGQTIEILFYMIKDGIIENI